jgi:hypothetical protein
VEEIGALRDFVLDNLHMGSQEALFNMGFWMCSIVDLRMVSSVSSRCTAKRCMGQPQGSVLGDFGGQPQGSVLEDFGGQQGRDTPGPIAVGSGNLPKSLLS